MKRFTNRQKKYLSLVRIVLCIVKMIACVVYLFTHFAFNMNLLYIVIAIIIAILLTRWFYKQYKILNAGIKAEKESYKALKHLPKEYKVYKNVSLEFKNQHTELDQLIMSQYGIVIVETKSYSGKLSGYEDAQQWTYIKHLPKGKNQTTKIKNPLMQLEREIYILTRILKKE
ncbi:MAG: NERD domain-containing protein [Erysipelotrichaceae bacterium]|nr:NERD domain-containing protein [Erysipelotrichaceae bacterium]